MKISKIAGYVGAGLMAASCTVNKPAPQKAIEHSAKYLTGTEIVAAQERAAKILKKDYNDYSKDIFYWDSITSVNKEKESFKKGLKYINDSVAGKNIAKPVFNLPMEPDVSKKGEEIMSESRREASKYYSGEEMLSLQKKSPLNNGNSIYIKYGTYDNYKTHYFGKLAIAGAERKGFQNGLDAGRKNLQNKSK